METKKIALAVAAVTTLLLAALIAISSFKTQGSVCTAGEKTSYSCKDNTTLAWRECVQGEWLEKERKCVAPSYCSRPIKGSIGCFEEEAAKESEKSGKATATAAATTSKTTQASPLALKKVGTPPSGVRPSPSIGAKAYEPGVMKCGDGVCDPTESCWNCVADCGCDETEYCAESGVCVSLLSCGDDNCTPQERKDGLCCTDCGCPENEFCNEYLQACKPPAHVLQETINFEATAFAERHGFTLGEYSVEDSWWMGESVKLVTIHCAQDDEEIQRECGGQLVIFENGTVLDFLFA
ncbi:MAG: hypothetical protein QW343_03805 [Candidatus Norongarragalinales archaeon]